MNDDLLVVGVSSATADKLGHAERPPGVRFVVVEVAPSTIEVVWRRQHDRTAWLVGAVEAVRSVRWVHTDTVGIDRLSTEPFVSRGIMLTNGRGAHSVAVSEWALAAILLAAKRMDRVVLHTRERTWQPWFDNMQLAGRTVFILGAGSIGSMLARVCHAMGMRTVGASRTRRATADFDVTLSANDDWSDDLSIASFVVACLPGTTATFQLVDDTFLAKLPAHAWFINVGRGSTVDEMALLDAVRASRLGGAILDTVGTEPLPPEAWLWRHPNIVICPHISSFTDETDDLTARLFIEELKRYRRGVPLTNLVNLERGY